MAKIRIYELAKELGVDNKVVIDKAHEIGMKGKSSHSNTLEPDEADQLRRAVIRQALGVQPDRETIVRRKDSSTGETESVVEKRKGNIIRRRKASSDEVESSDGASAVLLPELAAEPDAPMLAEESTAPSVEAAPPEAAEEERASDEPLPLIMGSQPPAQSDHTSQSRVVDGAQLQREPGRRTTGPRVLGRMELPVVRRPEPRSTEVRRPATGVVGAVRPVTSAAKDEEERRKEKAFAGKGGRKKEILRGDLVDYEGGDQIRRLPRNSKRRDRDSYHGSSTEVTVPKASKRVVTMQEMITVGELARQLSTKSAEIISKLIGLGVFATINQGLDKDTATILAEEFNYTVESVGFDEKEVFGTNAPESAELMKARPPVVTVMGHVDHGKTTLLDTIRDATVASGEAGGITQHIGAYEVVLKSGQTVTFLDTPGHAAFTSMRARGAKVTDIVVLVVAADDGVMPQTIEALNHAKAAHVPIIVAVNKIDKPGATPDRVKQQLAEHGLQPEDWGGDTMFFHVSALQKTGIQELLEGILLQAEVRELKANPDRKAQGAVVESRQERGRGTVATVLIQHGTLRIGDIFIAGACHGRVRSMTSDRGLPLKEAGPSKPLEITGFEGVPDAGDDFMVVDNEAQSREVSENRAKRLQEKEAIMAAPAISIEELGRRANNQMAEELNVIIKGDVHGSVEAIRHAVEGLSNEKVRAKVLHAAVGGITESDVQLALTSRAMILGFGVRGEVRALHEAELRGIDVRFYRVIYELIDDVRSAMAGKLAPIRSEVQLGRVEVRNTFTVSKVGTIAGGFVQQGLVKRGAHVRLMRDSKVVYVGKMSSLKRFKDDAREVASGFECGIGIEGYNDVKVGDVIEVFEVKETAATL